MEYIYWLFAISTSFALLERLRPARKMQRALRPQLVNDLFYLVCGASSTDQDCIMVTNY